MSTPAEKAKELVDKYKRTFKLDAPVYITEAEYEEWDMAAKDCAIIAVEMVLEEMPSQIIKTTNGVEQVWNNPRYGFYQDVEEELKRMP